MGALRAEIDERHDGIACARLEARARADALRAEFAAAEAQARELEAEDRWLMGQRALVDDHGRRAPIMTWAVACHPEPEPPDPKTQAHLRKVRGWPADDTEGGS